MSRSFLSSYVVLTLLFSLVYLGGCKDPVGKHNPTPYNLILPPRFPEMKVPAYNPLTVEGVALGKKLYYDPMLSENNDRSCSGCHLKEHGFATPGQNVLPHINLGYNSHFLWNGKVGGELEDIMLFEAKDFFKAPLEKFRSHAEYPGLFEKAFGSKNITYEAMARALAQYLRTVISGNSKFDKYLRGEMNLTPAERNGMTLFFTEKGDCFHCHGAPFFTDNSFHNIGLDSVFNEDKGRYEITGKPEDIGKWKTSTLRNSELRKSYMHDGRFKTLEEVVNFYNSDIKLSPTLDPSMTKPGKNLQLGLTEKEKADLVSFLKTLTDVEFITNPDL